ncbi:MAG TPA: nucleoside triphosphate pyrophosphohydrolase [Candidatus Saccharicenans sp.]|nr:nucleoside triphosphate pyrophosphohydrolase [Candidatus Saccharicenans sp.]HRD02345.1 nucleoside triphosphate pyrophosphohydrolase [Candidatus Saccharicenans sp.]
MKKSREAARQFEQLLEIMTCLRSPEGCPWDRSRSKEDIINYFLEETYEAVDALRSKTAEAAREELGDVLMEIVFLSLFYEEAGHFSMAEVIEGINRKMLDRHPHVFGRLKKASQADIVADWQSHKMKEKNRHSVLEGLPASTPSLLYAFLLGQRAATHGFDWPDAHQALKKVEEELDEFQLALQSGGKEEIAEELGDLLFSLSQVARLLGHNPEIVLRDANKKFEKRFRQMEREIKKKGKNLGNCSAEELDWAWEKIKEHKVKDSPSAKRPKNKKN